MPEPVRALETEKIAEGRYCISDGITRCYLFVGAEKALLLDSGFGEFPIGEAVGAITDLPLLLLNSHSHADHCMGNDQFPSAAVYIQKEGVGRVRGGTVTEVAEGDSFDLGGIRLEILETPGHTPDCITVADPGLSALFTGDSVELFHGGVRLLDEQIASVKKLLALKDRYPVYYPSHGPVPCRMDEGVETLLECLEKLRDGELQGKPLHLQLPPDIDIHTFEYDYKNINLNYNPELGPWA